MNDAHCSNIYNKAFNLSVKIQILVAPEMAGKGLGLPDSQAISIYIVSHMNIAIS